MGLSKKKTISTKIVLCNHLMSLTDDINDKVKVTDWRVVIDSVSQHPYLSHRYLRGTNEANYIEEHHCNENGNMKPTLYQRVWPGWYNTEVQKGTNALMIPLHT